MHFQSRRHQLTSYYSKLQWRFERTTQSRRKKYFFFLCVFYIIEEDGQNIVSLYRKCWWCCIKCKHRWQNNNESEFSTTRRQIIEHIDKCFKIVFVIYSFFWCERRNVLLRWWFKPFLMNVDFIEWTNVDVMSLNAIIAKIICKSVQYSTICKHFKMIVISATNAMICRRNMFIELL